MTWRFWCQVFVSNSWNISCLFSFRIVWASSRERSARIGSFSLLVVLACSSWRCVKSQCTKQFSSRRNFGDELKDNGAFDCLFCVQLLGMIFAMSLCCYLRYKKRDEYEEEEPFETEHLMFWAAGLVVWQCVVLSTMSQFASHSRSHFHLRILRSQLRCQSNYGSPESPQKFTVYIYTTTYTSSQFMSLLR